MARNSSLLLNELGIGVLWRRTMRRRSCELNEGKRLNLGDTRAAQCNHCEPVYSSWSAQNSQITCNPGAGCISMFTIWMGRVQKMCFRTLNSSENTHYVYITCTIFKRKKSTSAILNPWGGWGPVLCSGTLRLDNTHERRVEAEERRRGKPLWNHHHTRFLLVHIIVAIVTIIVVI